jgi:hypothetical protein
MNNAISSRNNRGTLVTGFILIAVGTISLLDRFDVADFGDIVRMWWPMIIVLIGVPKLFQPRTMWAGLWLVAVGAWLQMVRFHAFGMTFRTSWPFLLIALGAGLTLRALFDAAPDAREERHDA